MHNPETPICNIKWLAIPSQSKYCTSYYSDFIACSSKLLHFLPLKSSKDFQPPTTCMFHESSSFIVTVVGKTLIKYDICTGSYLSAFPTVSPTDITAIVADGSRGRRLFCGNSKGHILMINFMDGSIIDQLAVHGKEVTTIACHRPGDRVVIFSGSLDGQIGMLEESNGVLKIRTVIEHVFGDVDTAVYKIKHAPQINTLLAVSMKSFWGLWDDTTLKRILVVREQSIVNAVCIVGVSRDAEDLADLTATKDKLPPSSLLRRNKENLITLAVAMSFSVNIYTFDIMENKGVHSFQLLHKREIYITDICVVRFPTSGCVNYSVTHAISTDMVGTQFVATTDDGSIITWNGNEVRIGSEKAYRKTHGSSTGSVLCSVLGRVLGSVLCSVLGSVLLLYVVY